MYIQKLQENEVGIGDFWLQLNNGKKKISLDNLNELRKDDIKDKAELIKLFDFFNTNKTDGSEEVLDKQELTSLFNALSKTAQSNTQGDNSVFEETKAQQYLEQTRVGNKSLKDLGVTANNLFEFLTGIIKSQDVSQTEKTGKKDEKNERELPEYQKDVLDFLKDIRVDMQNTLNERKAESGVLSYAVDVWQGIFNHEISEDGIEKAI